MTKTEANQRARGDLLRLVRRYGVNGISYEGIERVFFQAGKLGSSADLEEHIQYLTDKEYLKKEQAKEPMSGVERWLVWITPKGIDLLEGTIPSDPGVELVC